MKFENTEVYGFKRALKGMRNPLESWHKNDTVEENGKVIIGENDFPRQHCTRLFGVLCTALP